MKNFEKGKKQAILILIAYLLVSGAVAAFGIESLKPESMSYSSLIVAYVILNVIVAISVYIYTKNILQQANNSSNEYSLMTEQERKEEEEKKRIQIEKQQSQARAEQEKKIIGEKVAEIADPLDDEVFPENYFDQLLINLSKTLNLVQGVAYTLNRKEGKYEIKSTYAYYTTDTNRKFEIGEGITGQVAKDQQILLLDNVPQNYIRIVSGLGDSSPRNLIVIPVVFDDETISVLELASFEKPSMNLKEFYKAFNQKVGHKIADILK